MLELLPLLLFPTMFLLLFTDDELLRLLFTVAFVVTNEVPILELFPTLDDILLLLLTTGLPLLL